MEESEVSGPFEGFDPKVQLAVEGLLHLGDLRKDVSFAGHTWGLRTLRADEEIAAALAVQDYRETLKEPEAFVSAQIGLALTHIDGEEDFCPPAGPDKQQFAKARYNYVTQNWYWPVISYLYQEYTELVSRQIEAIRAVQDLSERSRLPSSPSPDSLNVPGTSSDEMPAEPPNSAE